MTRYLPLLFCLSACQTADGAAGLVGPPGPQGPQGEQGPKGDPAPAAKQLHLINTDTGEDLGLFVSFGAAYSEKLGGVVYYTSRAGLSYPDLDCKGAAMMQAGGLQRASALIPGPGGTLLRPMMRAAAKFHQKSFSEWADGKTKCNNAEADVNAVPFSDTGIRMVPMDDTALDVELR